MHAHKTGLSMIQVVRTLTQIKIKNVDAVHLLHAVVLAAQSDMLRNGLGHTIQNTFKVVQLTSVLDFHDDYLALAVQSLDVNTVELVIASVLIGLALKYLLNRDLLTQKNGKKSLQHTKVGLVSQHTLGRPVKTYKLVILVHHTAEFGYTHCKETKIPPHVQTLYLFSESVS